MRPFVLVFAAALAGYLFLDRGFAYLTIPGLPVYAGEVVLGIGLIGAVRISSQMSVLVHQSGFVRVLWLFIAFSAVYLVVDLPRHGIDAIRDSAMWYYGLAAVLLALALHVRSTTLEELGDWYRKAIPWFLLWAPVSIWIERTLSYTLPTVPGSSTYLISIKPGNVAVHSAMAVAFVWLWEAHSGVRSQQYVQLVTALGLTSWLVAGSQNRGGLVSGALVLGLAMLMNRQRRRMIGTSLLALSFLLGLFILTGIRIETGDRTISITQLAQNVVNTFAVEDYDEQGTINWRIELWEDVIADTASGVYGPFGMGFGPSVTEFYDVRYGSYMTDQPLRSAHNSHVTWFARTGYLGLFLWLTLLVTWFVQLGRIHRRERRRHPDSATTRWSAWLLASVPGILVNAIFDPTLESPQAGLWLWACIGLGAALMLPAVRGLARSERELPRTHVAGTPRSSLRGGVTVHG